jgi:hypothetical protein
VKPLQIGAAQSAHHIRVGGGSIAENIMRYVLGLGLLITLCASANAATVHHSHTHHDVIIRLGVISSFAAIPGRAYAPPRPPVHYDDTPSYDDPSKFGG